MTDTIILGSGVAGLSAARRLRDAGHQVRIVDKGRGVGGRLATRRIGEARLDHGAQFFTTRSDEFKATIAAAVRDGAVREWCRGFGDQDGYPRYCGATGMTDLAKWLARDLDVELGTEIDGVSTDNEQMFFVGQDGGTVQQAANAIVTAPIPQLERLLDQGQLLPRMGPLPAALAEARYFATLALLVVVEGAANVPEPGGVQFSEGPFTFVADNHRKGISSIPALTFHAEHDYSLRRFDDDEDAVHAELLQLAAPWIGGATVVTSQLKKWRYAGPIIPQPTATSLHTFGSARLALAGDAWAGPKVEGAFLSGLAAAEALLATT